MKLFAELRPVLIWEH